MRIRSSRTVVALTALACGLVAFESAGNGAGIFGRSGRTVGFTCAAAACHGIVPGDAAITFSMAPLNADFPPISLGFVPGATYGVRVTVSGGPAANAGFNWDSNGGTSRATDANTQANTAPMRLAEVAHTAQGSALGTWSFEWTAPLERNAVGFWYSGTSGDGDGSRLGDFPAPPASTQAPPVPVFLLARIGTVNDAAGDPVPVLFVNGSRGDDSRVVSAPTGGAPLTISLSSYPGARAAIPYVLYALRRENRSGDEATISGVGLTCFPFPPSGGFPVVVANTLGRPGILGAPRAAPTPLGPGPILALPAIPARYAGASLTLQGLVPDKTAPMRAAVTNGVVVRFF